jgi:Phytoene/squalene synthetase
MALQLINVLRDAGSDLRAGRCYFPEHELGGAPDSVADPLRTGAVPIDLSNVAGEGKGRPYVWNGIFARDQKSSLRAATVLPALIGARTLALLNASGPAALQRTVKVARREVRAMILPLALTMVSRRKMDAIFDRAKL